MKEMFLHLYANYYRHIGIKLYAMLKEMYGYKYYLSVYKDISKIKNVKTDLLTKEQKVEIDTFYKKHYGKKVPYMWHNLMVCYSNKFDVRYIPPDIFMKIRDKLNSNKPHTVIYDKNLFYRFTEHTNIKKPKRLFYSINSLFFDSSDNMISRETFYNKMSNIGEAFIKPANLRNSGYAKNCRIINIINGIDTYSNTSIKDIIEKYYTYDFLVQEKIVCHKSISDIYSKSVNTFSVYTFVWNNEVKVLKNPLLKIGMSGNITDYSGIASEGLIIGINNDGTLFDSALCVKQDKWYTSHPDTGVVFKNHKIFNFQKVLETAKRFHSRIPWLNFCRWDITIDVTGEPVCIEVEEPTEVFQQQIFYKKGLFGEYTEELLSCLNKKAKQ